MFNLLHIYSAIPIPVLNGEKRFHHLTVPAGFHILKRGENPFPRDYSSTPAPDWWFVDGGNYGMSLEAFILLHRGDGQPIIQILGEGDKSFINECHEIKKLVRELELQNKLTVAWLDFPVLWPVGPQGLDRRWALLPRPLCDSWPRILEIKNVAGIDSRSIAYSTEIIY